MKLRFFKNISIITTVFICLFFIMNDGKKEVISKKYKQLDAREIKAEHLFKKVHFLPKEYTEIVTDTTLASGYHVTIKYASLMTKSVVKKDLLINGGQETYYRKFASNITILKNNSLFFEIELPFKKLNSNEILQYVWLDEMESTDEKLIIKYAMYDPSTDEFKDYQLHIDEQGKSTHIDLRNNV